MYVFILIFLIICVCIPKNPRCRLDSKVDYTLPKLPLDKYKKVYYTYEVVRNKEL